LGGSSGQDHTFQLIISQLRATNLNLRVANHSVYNARCLDCLAPRNEGNNTPTKKDEKKRLKGIAKEK